MCRSRAAGWAFLALLAACSRSSPPPSGSGTLTHDGPVVLITIDTLRADRVGAMGSTRGLTPRIDGLGATSGRTFVFRQAIAQVPLTLPSHATILTGLHPAKHSVRTNDGFRLPEGVPTIAEAFGTAGYATAAFIGGYPLNAATGIGRGFTHFDDEFVKTRVNERRAGDVVARASAWMRQQAGAEPARARFFAWLHLFDPHTPYEPPPEFAAAHPGQPYDGEIAYTDAALGQLFDAMSAAGIFDRTLIVIVADHGEGLGEHGERTHGTFVYDSTIRVPLIVRVPTASAAAAPVVVDQVVETADIAPTLAALAKLPARPGLDGVDLVPLLSGAVGRDGSPAAKRETVYAETYYQNVLLGWSPLRTARGPDWKFIEAPRPELHNLEKDPGETTNLALEQANVARALAARLPGATAAAPGQDVGAEAAERLGSLGYVAGHTVATAANAADPKDKIAVWNAIEHGIEEMGRNPADATRSLDEAIRLDPANGLAMKYRADASFRAGRLDEAARRYEQALAAGFRHADVYINLATIAERRGKLDEAQRTLSEAVKAAPHDADAWNRLGQLDARAGRLAEARRDFAAAIEAAPNRAEPRYNLGLVERQTGNNAAAQTRFAEAIERDPRHAQARYELATGWLASGQPARALDEYRAALAVRPDYAEALFGAARAALDLGRVDEARRDYEHFIRIAPPEYRQQIEAARGAIRRLEQGGKP